MRIAIQSGLRHADTWLDEAGRVAQVSRETLQFGRETPYQVLAPYAMRMAGAFTIVTTTIGILTRRLTVVGAVIGIARFLTVESFAWAEIMLRLWVLVLRIHLLAQPHVDAQVSRLRHEPGPSDTSNAASAARFDSK